MVAATVFWGEMPITLAMTRLTSPLTLTAPSGKEPHQVLVGVAEDVIVIGAIIREVELEFSKMAIKVAEAI